MGIVIKEINGLPEVAAMAEGGTFQKAGVVIGDILSHVNSVSVREMTASGRVKCSYIHPYQLLPLSVMN